MGYEVEPDTINIRHPNHPGLLVVARSMPFGRLLEIERAASNVDVDDFVSMEKFTRETIQDFVDAVVEWNLERDGEPVPVTVDALLALPSARLPFQLVNAWKEALAAVDAPLATASSSGDNLPGAPIPMVPRSAGRAS